MTSQFVLQKSPMISVSTCVHFTCKFMPRQSVLITLLE